MAEPAPGGDRHQVYIGFGGNIGPVLAAFARALRNMPGIGLRPHRLSPVYRSKAQLPQSISASQPDYLNAVAEVDTALTAEDTLAALLRLEQMAGRCRQYPWQARTLDLDLLLYAQETIAVDNLLVPHPRLRQRLFVLQPLEDLNPNLRLPDGSLVADIRQALERSSGEWVERVEDTEGEASLWAGSLGPSELTASRPWR